MPETTYVECFDKLRTRFILMFFYSSGLRISEVAGHNMSAFKKIYDHQYKKYRWWLFIVGKGQKFRKVPVTDELLEALIAYRRIRHLSDLPAENEHEPIINSQKTNDAITARRINQIIKEVTYQAAEKFEKTQPELAAKLRKFSARWCRHLSCTVQGLVGVKKNHTKDNLGHASLDMVENYDHSLDKLRHEDIQKLISKPKVAQTEVKKVMKR